MIRGVADGERVDELPGIDVVDVDTVTQGMHVSERFDRIGDQRNRLRRQTRLRIGRVR